MSKLISHFKWILWGLACCSLYLPVALFANACAVSIGSEWLYMMPTFDQPNFAVKGRVDRVGTNIDCECNNSDQQFNSGFRVEAATFLPCLPRLSFRYTYYNQPVYTIKTSPIDDLNASYGATDYISTLFNNTGFIETTQRFQHQSFDALASFYQQSKGCVCWELFGGIKFAKLVFTDELKLQSSTFNAQYDSFGESTSSGIGPQLGASANWTLFRCLSFVSRAQVGCLARSLKNKTNYFENRGADSTARITTNPDRFWKVIENIEWKLGFDLNTTLRLPFCGGHALPFKVEAGYESDIYTSFANRYLFTDEVVPEIFVNLLSDFSLQGPYVKANLSF